MNNLLFQLIYLDSAADTSINDVFIHTPTSKEQELLHSVRNTCGMVCICKFSPFFLS